MFIRYAATDPVFYFSWIILAAFSICCHEYAHAAAARGVGDETAAHKGHLTLNPLVQMSGQSIVMLVLFGIAWGAVPVGLDRVRTRRSRAWIAIAGPLANLLLCLIFALLIVVAQRVSAGNPIQQLAAIGGAVNGMLFVFNILPVPVLDGFAVLSAFHSELQNFASKHATTTFLVFILLLWSTPLGSLVFGAGSVLSNLFTSFFHSLFLILS